MPAKLPSAKNKVIIAGESPLVEDLAALCVVPVMKCRCTSSKT
jgi:hypothetical protein